MDDHMEISAASEADREWCARVMASSEPWKTLGRGLDDCRRRCGHPEYELFVAKKGEARLGFILLHPRGLAGSPYIAAIAVAEEHRSRGAGTELLSFAEQHFSPQARHLFLCVSSFNDRARLLYERLGYAVAAELKDYVIDGASEILMHKRLK